MLTVLVSVHMLTKKEPIVENTDRLIFLIEKAASIVGSEYKLAKKMEIPQQNLSNWKSGSKTCPPAVRAILAGIAGENAADELIRATMEREEGTRRGLLLGELLGKRAARVVEESQAAESPAHAALQAVVDQLDMTDEREREARAGILAVLGAFPEGDQDVKVNTKSKKVNKAWLNDHVNDTYVKLAKKDGFRARAAYKLKEIDEVLGLIKPGQCVVDLGSAPGAWSQYVRRKLSPQGAAMGQLDGAIVAMDILPMEAIEGVVFIQGDFREEATLQAMHTALGPKASGHMVDVVVSDMAPNLSGIETVDAARISHLVELAVEFATLHLRPEGALVAKVFHGSGYSELVNLFRAHFRVVKPMKPKASRDKSSETFLVGMGLKTPQS